MNKSSSPQLDRFDLPAARSLFRSLFTEGWQEIYPTWQDTITRGSLEWSFTADSLKEIASELDQLLAYPDSAIEAWLPKICTGLPNASPDPNLTTREFITQVQALVSQMAEQWEAHGKPRRGQGNRWA